MATVTDGMNAEHAASLGRRYLIRFEEDTLRPRPLWIRLIIEFLGTFVLVTVAAGSGQLRALEADLAVLLAEEDVAEVGRVLQPGSAAAVLVWENVWAAPFGAAVRRSGGQLVASGRIPTQALMAAAETGRGAETEGGSLRCLCSGSGVTGRG